MLPSGVKFALQPRPPRKLTPLFSADPRFSHFSLKSGIVTPLESALTDTPCANFFRISTYKNTGGYPYHYSSLATSQRKQRRRLRWVGGDGFEFGVAEAERVGHLNFGGFEHANEF